MEVRLEPEAGLRPPKASDQEHVGPGVGGVEEADQPPDPASDATLQAEPPTMPESHPTGARFRRIGYVQLTGPLHGQHLAVYWIDAYGGGLFLPFRDATAGRESYGAGRYLLDTIKGADLGGDAERGTLLLDFNMAYPPSCAYDPRWACPLAPPDTFLSVPVVAGERLFHPVASLPSSA